MGNLRSSRRSIKKENVFLAKHVAKAKIALAKQYIEEHEKKEAEANKELLPAAQAVAGS